MGGIQGEVDIHDLQFEFNGRNIERWMLKVICGGIATGLYGKRGRAVPIDLVEILFEKRPWPSTIALHTTRKKEYIVPEEPRVNFSFMGELTSSHLAGLVCKYFALDLVLPLGPYEGVPGIKQPSKLVFVNDDRSIEIKLDWVTP